jgi:hypothetical protein
MSDDYIHIIPADPGVVPNEAKQQAAVASHLRELLSNHALHRTAA